MYKFALVATASALSLNGNATGNATASTLPYGQTDYGVAGGVTYHSETMGLANERWARQNAGVQGQAASDVWRNKGLKAAWGTAPDPQPPKIAFATANVTANATVVSAACITSFCNAHSQDPHCSWVSHLNTTTDYGVSGGAWEHEHDTMKWNNMKEQ